MSINQMLLAMKAKVGSPARKLVLIKLADNANDSGTCFPSYKHLADHCEMSKRSVIIHINNLEKDGFITKSCRKTPSGNTSNTYTLSIKSRGEESAPPSAKSAPPSEESAPPLVKNLHPEPVTSLTSHLTSHKTISEQVSEIFDYWLDAMGKDKKTSKLTDKRSKAISARISEGYEIETIKLAIDGCRADDWSMGENDRKKAFNDIELICRTGEKLEHFADGGAQIDTDTSYLNEPSVFDMPDDLNVINGVFKNA